MLALRDVHEEGREEALFRAVRTDFIDAPERRGREHERRRLLSQGDVAVSDDPLGFDVGDDLADRATQDVFGAKTCLELEGWIHLDEAVVDRLASVIHDDLVQGETLMHLVEKVAEPVLHAEQFAGIHVVPHEGPPAPVRQPSCRSTPEL